LTQILLCDLIVGGKFSGDNVSAAVNYFSQVTAVATLQICFHHAVCITTNCELHSTVAEHTTITSTCVKAGMQADYTHIIVEQQLTIQ